MPPTGIQADIAFDTTGIIEGQLAPGAITSSHVVDSSNPTVGMRRLLVYSPANSVLTNGEIARIPFTVAVEPADERRSERANLVC